MNQRLRKKLHLGEFTEFYAEIQFESGLGRSLTDDEFVDLHDQMVERGVACGGEIGPILDLTIGRCTCAERPDRRCCGGSMDDAHLLCTVALLKQMFPNGRLLLSRLADVYRKNGVYRGRGRF